MKRNIIAIALLTAGFALAAEPQAVDTGTATPRIFIEPQNGFESFISAAIIKKHVPVVGKSENRADATFIITSAVQTKEESGAGKIARCLFAYCIGIQGTQAATVQLVRADSP